MHVWLVSSSKPREELDAQVRIINFGAQWYKSGATRTKKQRGKGKERDDKRKEKNKRSKQKKTEEKKIEEKKIEG